MHQDGHEIELTTKEFPLLEFLLKRRGACCSRAGAGEGVGGTTNAVALAALGSTKIVNGDTASGAFASFLGGVRTTVASASADHDAKAAALTQAQTQRDALSGVSSDEEAAALTQYQRSYEAAAKVLAVVNSMMAAALNLGVQTTVS